MKEKWLLLLIVCLLLTGCAARDPHAGMVEIFNGTAYDWITPDADVPVSDLQEVDFYSPDDGQFVRYNGETYRAVQGVDVSYFQGEIDWQAAAADGIEFAMIRAGYRGYTDGGVSMDERFRANAQGALDAGLEIGLYFFSQATTEEEARAEAAWLVSAASEFSVTLPLVYDWEIIAEADARTDSMTGAEMTACAAAFCDAVRAAGYTPCIYMNAWQGYYEYDLGALQDAALWISATGTWDSFYYAHSFWQYTYSGAVRGITGSVDRDLRFVLAE